MYEEDGWGSVEVVGVYFRWIDSGVVPLSDPLLECFNPDTEKSWE